MIRGKEKLKEIIRKQRCVTRIPLNKILKYKDKSKDQAMYEAYLQYGYSLKDIAEYIGVHYTTVSIAIKKTRGNIKSDIARTDPIIYRPHNLPLK